MLGADEEHIETVKDENQVEIVELSDNEFAVDNDDIKDEYENQEELSHDATNEEFDIQEKSLIEEHEYECYECQLTFRKGFHLHSITRDKSFICSPFFFLQMKKYYWRII